MSPRHFYRANYPRQAKDNDIGLSNAFVAFTHAIGLSNYFSFTPPIFDRDAWRGQHSGREEVVDPYIVDEIWGGDKKDYDHTSNPPSSI